MTKEAARWLRVVRLLHTAAWAVFAGCIVAIPVLAWQGRFGVAARYTDDRRANFDIYLPEWLARYN